MEIAELRGQPETFRGKLIRVRGVARIEWEHLALADGRPGRSTKDEIWITLPKREWVLFEPCDGRDVLVEGTFDPSNTGHFGQFASGIAAQFMATSAPLGPEAPDSSSPRGNDAGDARVSVDRHGTPLPPDCVKALELIDYLAARCGNSEGFAARNCKPLDVERVAAGISPRGLVFFDVNESVTRRYSIAEIRAQLGARKGHAFDDIAHLGYMYWRPQHTRASCYEHGMGIDVRLGSTYRLRFDETFLLSGIDYVMVEGH